LKAISAHVLSQPSFVHLPAPNEANIIYLLTSEHSIVYQVQ